MDVPARPPLSSGAIGAGVPRVASPARRPVPLRHKVMLLLAVEILVTGFTQARLNPYRPGILVETPAKSGHAIV